MIQNYLLNGTFFIIVLKCYGLHYKFYIQVGFLSTLSVLFHRGAILYGSYMHGLALGFINKIFVALNKLLDSFKPAFSCVKMRMIMESFNGDAVRSEIII